MVEDIYINSRIFSRISQATEHDDDESDDYIMF